MLMDVIATALAFVVVVLLLSLLVTGLTQFVTASLRLRVRNLRRALTILINDIEGGGQTKSSLRPQVNLVLKAANFGTTQAPEDMIAGLGLIRVAWIRREDLIKCLDAANVALSLSPDEVQRRFSLLEAYMEKRFALFTRYITVVLALLVAIWFQVSAPELLGQLWSDADRRARYTALSSSFDAENGAAQRELTEEELTAFDLMPWKDGAGFYRSEGHPLGLNWDHLFGVTLTAFLLTFGAPFWYARLKDVARLRDSIAAGSEEKPDKAKPTTVVAVRG